MENWTPKDLENRLDAGAAVFLKLWKPGCGACKLSIPALERIEAADTHDLAFGQINTDEYPEMLGIADTDVLPAFFVFRDKKMAGKFIGFKGIAKLEGFIGAAFQDAGNPPEDS